MKQKNPYTVEFSHRPPYLINYRSYRKPLTVLATLLSRADNTPLQQRRRDPQNLLDSEGKIVTDLTGASQKLALTSDPNIGYEKWTEYWRKVHGARFLYAQDGEEGKIQHLLRYNQVHRISGGPTSFMSPPYVPPIDENGDLFDTVIGHIPEYQRPEWDGIAYLAFETPADLQAVFSQEQLQTKILPEDRAIFREMAPVLATEHILLPSVTQRDPLLLVKTHLRQNGMDRPEFQKFWLHEHADLVLAQSATHRYVKRYVQLHNTGPTAAGEPFWHPAGSRVDGITIMAFASMNDVEDFLLTEDYQKIAAHEHQITDPRTSAYWTALNYNIVNRGYPEHATAR